LQEVHKTVGHAFASGHLDENNGILRSRRFQTRRLFQNLARLMSGKVFARAAGWTFEMTDQFRCGTQGAAGRLDSPEEKMRMPLWWKNDAIKIQCGEGFKHACHR